MLLFKLINFKNKFWALNFDVQILTHFFIVELQLTMYKTTHHIFNYNLIGSFSNNQITLYSVATLYKTHSS